MPPSNRTIKVREELGGIFMQNKFAGVENQEFHELTKVREIQKKLSTIFKSGGSEQIDETSAAGACLGPLLTALDWTGEARHLQEALPHFDEVRDIDGLRSVLARLNYETRPRPRRMSWLRQSMLPCLYATEGGDLYVVIGVEEDGQFLVFDGKQNAFCHIQAPYKAGTAYLIQPVDFEDRQKNVDRNGWVQNLLVKFKRTFFNLFLLTFCINVLALVVPVYVMNVYDKAVGAKSMMTLGYLLAGVVLALCADALLRSIRARYMAYLGTRIESLVSTAAFEKLLHLPLGMTESAPMGTQVTRLKQFESVREIFTGALATTILDFPFFLVFLAAILAIGGTLGLVPVVLMCVYAVMAFITVPMTRARVRRAGDAKSQNRNFLMEFATKRDTIRDSGAEDVWLERFRDIAGKMVSTQSDAQKFGMTVQTIAQALVMIAGAATVGLGTLMVLDGDLTPGALIAVMALVWRILSPLQSAFLSLNRIGQTTESFQQINNLMRVVAERQPGQLPTFYRKFKGELAVKRVAFRFSPRAEPSLRSIDLSVKAGEFIAITGPSGAGKSTLLKILARLYQPQAGVVTLDRLDLRQLDVAELRQAIGYVPQRASFFYGTIAQNFKLADPTATREDMIAALDAVGALQTVKGLEDGLDTRLTARAKAHYSAGFLQQLMLARALVKNASIYLMDEPGNNLDENGDQALIETLGKMRGKATIIIVTHRPSHMRLADRVVVLDQGLVAGEGTPEQVLPALYKRQNDRALENS